MPMPQNLHALIGAGVFGIVCAATLYVVEHYRQDRRRHAMSKDLARINNELALLRQELDTLLSQQKHKGAKRVKKHKKAESFISNSTTTEDYSSAADVESSDLEFYDVSDDEINTTNLELNLEEIDRILDHGNADELNSCIQQLQNLCMEVPENPQLLWRLAKGHFKLYEKNTDQTNITKGIEACQSALNLKPELAEVHKWLAILLGERTKFQPMKDKILDGHSFKKHVDEAVKLDPSDASLHHMLGRFAYDVADLKWYERKVAAALFAEPPTATHEEALEHFLEAEKLSKDEWPENLLFIAKCKLKLGLVEEAVNILEKADAIKTDNGVDDRICLEIKELLEKHRR